MKKRNKEQSTFVRRWSKTRRVYFVGFDIRFLDTELLYFFSVISLFIRLLIISRRIILRRAFWQLPLYEKREREREKEMYSSMHLDRFKGVFHSAAISTPRVCMCVCRFQTVLGNISNFVIDGNIFAAYSTFILIANKEKRILRVRTLRISIVSIQQAHKVSVRFNSKNIQDWDSDPRNIKWQH